MRSVLVTGGAGYIGSVLIPKLLINRYKVYLVDNMIYGSDGVCSNQYLKVINKDYREVDFEKDKIKNIETVIHLASINFSSAFSVSKNNGKLINEEGSIKFFDYCKKSLVKKFIYLTSSSIYGENLSFDKTFVETDSLNPTSNFSNCEKNVQSYFLENSNEKFSTLILRIGEVVGYSPRMRFDLELNNMIKEGFLSNKINIKNSQSKFSMVSINYLADLICFLLYKKEIFLKKDNIFNVANYSDTFEGIAKLIKEKFGLLKKDSTFLINSLDKDKKKNLEIDIKKLNMIMPNKFKLNNKLKLDNAINSIILSFNRSRFGNNINDEKLYNDLFLKKNNIF